MLDVKKFKIREEYSEIYIETNEGCIHIICFNNLDLYWRCIRTKVNNDNPDIHEITITKEDYLVYTLFDDLYNRIVMGEEERVKLDDHNKYPLVCDGVIDWHSDDMTYDFSSRLMIKPGDDCYKIVFQKNFASHHYKISSSFSVRVGNDGKRYGECNVPFLMLCDELSEYNSNCHQVHIEEYLYREKKLQRKR